METDVNQLWQEAAPEVQERQTKPVASFMPLGPGDSLRSLPSTFFPKKTAIGCVILATCFTSLDPTFSALAWALTLRDLGQIQVPHMLGTYYTLAVPYTPVCPSARKLTEQREMVFP